MSVSRRQIVFGLHAVQALVANSPERVLELWIAAERDDPRVRDIQKAAGEVGLGVHRASAEALAAMAGAGASHQGVVAAVRPRPPLDDDGLLALLERRPGPPLLLVLDGVTDPHNLGACLRTADAAGVDAVVIPRDRSASLDSVARKVAVGAAETVPLASVTNLARTLEGLKRQGLWVVGTAADAPQAIYEADLRRPLALVLGAEGSGMRRLTRERCDFLVGIPMAGAVASLNVSVAAGVVLFEASRQRRARPA